MRRHGRSLFSFWLTAVLLVGITNVGRAGFIPIHSTTVGHGIYTGAIEFNATDSNHGTLRIELTNTTSEQHGGYITAFVLNNPSNLITGATLTTDNPNFNMIGDPAVPNGVRAPLFGAFDFGASTSISFHGGGPAENGIGVGQTYAFMFELTGTGLNGLSASSFLSEYSTGDADVAFLARFRGFNECNSDSEKVPATEISTPPPDHVATPEPATLTLAGLALIGAVGYRCRGRYGRRTNKIHDAGPSAVHH